jgi:hypothetical protein
MAAMMIRILFPFSAILARMPGQRPANHQDFIQAAGDFLLAIAEILHAFGLVDDPLVHIKHALRFLP